MKQTALLLLFLLLPTAASAGTISLVLTTRVTASVSAIHVELTLRNDGDEPARTLSPSVEFQGRVVSGPGIEILQPSSQQTVSFDVPIAGSGSPRGLWPVLVRVTYTDGGAYPFEALHVGLARVGDGGNEPVVRIQLPDAHVETTTAVHATLDRAGVDGPIRLGFATPAGVTVTPRIVTIAPGADSTVALMLTNVGATLTSRLPLVAIAEFDTADGHQTVTAVSMVEIGPSPIGSRYTVVAILFAVSLAAWAVLAVVAVRRRRANRGA